jgi:hypothetical protein
VIEPATSGTGARAAGGPVLAAGAMLAVPVVALAWWFGRGPGGLLYLLLYLAALLPGLPVGWRLFDRRHAAGWIAGGLLGYAFTAFALWAVLTVGLPRAAVMVGAWAVAAGVTWIPFLRQRRSPLVDLPVWTRRDTTALLLLLLIVPVLLAPTVGRVGAVDEAGSERYRAYFTADFLWHGALTAELARFDMPPKDPYAGDRALNYYWLYFLLPGCALGTNPFGVWPLALPILKINLLLSGLLFIGMLASFTWSIVPRAAAAAAGVALAVLAASAEGSYALYDALARGRDLDSLRQLNIDAITAWVFQSLSVDGLPRSLWYTPQHAMACALGLLAIMAAAGTRPEGAWRAALLAGVSLGCALATSPFLGGAFSLIYGATVLLRPHGGWRHTLRALVAHASAAIPVIMALGWCVWNLTFEGAGSAVAVGYAGPITKAPFVMPALALGPLLVAAAAGVLLGRARAASTLAPALAGAGIGLVLLYFVTMPGADIVWIGWRAGQILLLTLTPLAALGFAAAAEVPFKAAGRVAAAALFAVGLPTTIIDTYNAQDIWNRRMGAGFRWTVVVSPDQRRAFDWIRHETPARAIVQMDPNARGRETWTNIPTFAARRMAAGLPISLLRKPLYVERAERVRQMYATGDAAEASRIATSLGIDFLYADSIERREYGAGLAKFDEHPELFEPVFRGGEASVYKVVRSGDGR